MTNFFSLAGIPGGSPFYEQVCNIQQVYNIYKFLIHLIHIIVHALLLCLDIFLIICFKTHINFYINIKIYI